jgi:hypothetical protein
LRSALNILGSLKWETTKVTWWTGEIDQSSVIHWLQALNIFNFFKSRKSPDCMQWYMSRL